MNDTALAKVSPPLELQMLQLAIEKGMNVADLKELVALARQARIDAAAEQFAKAIAGFQSEMEPVVKGNPVRNKAGAVMYHFANFDDIMEVAQPIMSKYGISCTYDTEFKDAKMTTTCRVRVGTHVEATSVTLGIPSIPNANDAQNAGGALAYGQRYALKAALGIRVKGEDNDAAGLAERITDDEAKALYDMTAELPKFKDDRYFNGFIDYLAKAAGVEFKTLNEMPRSVYALALSEITRQRRKHLEDSK